MLRNVFRSPKNLTTQITFAPQLKLRRLFLRGCLLALLAGVMLSIFYKIEDLSYQSYVRDLKLDATVKVIEVRERIETEIFERILDLNGIATVVAQNPDITRTEFNLKAVDLILSSPEVRSVSAAPDHKVAMVFPLRGNSGMIGTDFREDPGLFAKIEQSIQNGEGLITGPVPLPSGGRGLILRKPVFAQIDDQRQQLWGTVSVTLDYDKFLTKLGIPEFERSYDLLIKEVSAVDPAQSEVLFGDASILYRQPIELAFNFPFGHWQFFATPDGGWPLHKPDYLTSWIERIVLMVLCLTTLWYVMSLLDRRRLAERLLSTGIEALDHGFVMFDSDRRLVAYNKKYKQLAGGSGMVRIGSRYEDIVKANLAKGLIPDAVGREEEWYAEWSKRLNTKEVDKEQVLADGSMIRAFDRPMEDGSVVGLRIDITDLKKAQVAAEAANKAKTDFMGVLSHELRTPLTVILGHAQLAKNIRNMPAYKKLAAEIEAHPEIHDDIKPKLDDLSGMVIKMMDALERSGNHLFTLISEILDFAKIDSGTLSMEIEPTRVASIVDPVVDQMRPMVEDKGLKLELDRVDVPVDADTKRVQQVLINLISNASKFTDEGSVSVSVVEEDDEIVFRVRDTGIGIPEDQLVKVFEAFHQVDSTSGRKYGGTGLGLAISRDIALAHGGDLSADSQYGKGSIFTLRMPKPEADAATPEASKEAIDKLVA